MSLHVGLDEVRTAPPEGFSFGGVLLRSLAILVWNFFGFLVMAVAVVAPAVALGFGIVAMAPGHRINFNADTQSIDFSAPGAAGWIFSLLLLLLIVAAYFVLQAVITYRVVQSLAGRKAGIGACLVAGIAAAPRLTGAGLVLLIGYAAPPFALMWALGRSFSFATGFPVAGAIIWGVLILCFLMFLLAVTWLVVPAMVMERAGPLTCFVRSWRLTRGHRWGILGLALLVYAVLAGIQYLLSLAIPRESTLGSNINLLLGLLFGLSGVVMAGVGYFHLRVEHDGPETVAQVFD